jgi:Flp pilus assembly protein TadB
VLAGSAGLTARRGLALVAERGPPVLRPAFIDVTGQLDAGAPLADALPRLVDSVGEPTRAMVRAVLTAERDGVPIRSLLAHLADDARRQRRHELEAAIRRLPVRLTFPLACCSLPAFVLLTVVPLVAAGLQRLGPVAT